MRSNMKTFKKRISVSGQIASTSLPVDSPVSRSRSQENAKGQKTTAIYGPQCSTLFELFDPAGSWQRTFSELLIGRKDWYSTRCALTWKRTATKYNRSLFRLAVSVLPTAETEYGLLPTVQTQGLKHCENGRTKFMQTDLLPTPHASDASRGGQKVTGLYKRKKSGLTYMSLLNDLAVSGLLPTPTANDAVNSSIPPSQIDRGSLVGTLMRGMLPTPKANDFRSGMANRVGTVHTQQLNDTIAYRTGKTSRLNPLFVEEMMGFPTCWILLPFLQNPSSTDTETPFPDGA